VEEELSGDVSGRTMAEASAPIEPVEDAQNLQVLNIWEIEKGRKVVYLYDIIDDQLGLAASGESPEIEDRADYVKSLYSEIENAWIASDEEAASFQERLQDFGSSLFSRLFPEPLQELLWKHRDQLSRLVVRSDEPFIPWELVHLKDPAQRLRPQEPLFLGRLGLVRWLSTAPGGFPPKTLRARPGRVHSLCARYSNPHTDTLDEIEQEEKFLVERLGATPLEPTDRAMRGLLRSGDFDLFHFAGHGRAEEDSVEQAVIQIADKEVEPRRYVPIDISATAVEQNANLNSQGDGAPLVVLNACQVGRAGLQLSSLGGFAQAFLRAGAAGFVGTLWSVGDAPARTFVETFYDRLLNDQPVVTAVREAREAARLAKDATWLAYVVYANPVARLQRTQE
jgi:hypothetical protein